MCGVGEIGRVCEAMWNDAMLAGGGFFCRGGFDSGAWNPATKNAFLSFGAVIYPPPPDDDHDDEPDASARSYAERCFIDLAIKKSQEYYPNGVAAGNIHITTCEGTIGTKNKEVAHKELNKFQTAYFTPLCHVLAKLGDDSSLDNTATLEAVLGVMLLKCFRDYALQHAKGDRANNAGGTRVHVPLFRQNDVNTFLVASPSTPNAKVCTHMLVDISMECAHRSRSVSKCFICMLSFGFERHH
jgi:hypothetical protein